MHEVTTDLRRVGLSTDVVTLGTPTAGTSYHVACIFWCRHMSARSQVASYCYRVTAGAKRVVLIRLDASPVPSELDALRRIEMSEVSREHPSPDGRGSAEWQRTVKLFVPTIQFDTSELRGQLNDAVQEFRHWLDDCPFDASDIPPLSKTVEAIVSGCWVFAGFSSPFLTLLASPAWAGSTMAALCLPVLAAWLSVVLPRLVALSDWRSFLDIDFEHPPPSTSASFFIAMWGFSTYFTSPTVAPAVMLFVWLVALGGLVSLYMLVSLGWRLLHHLATWFPTPAFACFLSYRSSDVPKDTKDFVDELEGALTRQRIAFYDGWQMRRASTRMRPDRSLHRQLTSAIRRSGFVVTFLSDDYFASPWCSFELHTAATLGRPTLGAIVRGLSATSRRQLPSSSISLFTYGRTAGAVLKRSHDPDGQQAAANALATKFRSELHQFISRLCAACHGHGTDRRYRFRLLPYRLQVACPSCRGDGLRGVR